MKKEKTIYDLELHEGLMMCDEIRVNRVSGGWIYTTFRLDSNTMSSVFVPFDDEFDPDNKPIKPVPPSKKIAKKSLCCGAEMTDWGQCLNCGGNGNIDKEVHSMEILTKEEHKKRYNFSKK